MSVACSPSMDSTWRSPLRARLGTLRWLTSWRSLTRLQGALELADAAGFVLPIKALHSQGRLDAWLKALNRSLEIIPIIHVERATYHRSHWHIAPGSGRSGGLGWSWEVP